MRNVGIIERVYQQQPKWKNIYRKATEETVLRKP